MEGNVLGQDALGKIIKDICAAGTAPDAVGRFACLQLGRTKHPNLSNVSFGSVLSNLVQSQASSHSIGQFVFLQFEVETVSVASKSTPQPTPVEAPDASLSARDVIQLLDARLAVFASSKRVKGQRDTKKLKLTINGKETSVVVSERTVHTFTQAFGTKRLRQLLNEIGANPSPAGVSRSYRVQQQMEQLIALYQDQEAATYPNGLKLIQGGSVK
jgi:hypothetical protein